MKCKLMQAKATLFPEPRADGPSLRILHQDDLLEFSRVKSAGGERWLEVILSDGTCGFLPGKTLLFALKRVVTNQPETPLYAAPGRESLKATLKKGTTLDLQGIVDQNGEKWIQVQDQAGNSGYLDGKVKVLQVRKPSLAGGIANTVFGAVTALAALTLLVTSIGISPLDWQKLLIAITWLCAGLGWLAFGIAQIVQARKK